MADYARIASSDILRDFRTALASFADNTTRALDESHSDVSRTIEWLKRDQLGYWKLQLRQRTAKMTQAKLALKNKKDLYKSPLGGRQAYDEEEKNFIAAQRQVKEAELKCERVKRWIQTLEKEIFEYRGQIQALNRHIQTEIPKARAQLDQLAAALDAYTSLETDFTSPEVAPDTDTTPLTRPAKEIDSPEDKEDTK